MGGQAAGPREEEGPEGEGLVPGTSLPPAPSQGFGCIGLSLLAWPGLAPPFPCPAEAGQGLGRKHRPPAPRERMLAGFRGRRSGALCPIPARATLVRGSGMKGQISEG